MVFDKQWFQHNQKILLWLLNTPVVSFWFRWVLRINGDRSSVGDSRKIYRILPNNITWVIGKTKNNEAIFQTEFRTNDKFARRLYYAFKPLWIFFHFWDWLIGDRVYVPKFSFGFLTFTQYPATTAADNPVDGRLYRGAVNEDWTTIQAGSGSSAETTETGNECVLLRATTTSNQYQYLLRSIYCYDTSGIPDTATISALTFSLCAEGRSPATSNGSTPLHVVGSTPASTSTLAASDFGNLGTTTFGNIAMASWTATDGTYNDISCNASGISNIVLDGISKFGVRFGWDGMGGGSPSWASAADSSFYSYFSKETGTSKDPKIVVTYTAGTTYTETYTDVITIAEVLAKSETRVVSDAITIVDTIAKRTTKLASETVTLVETFTKQPTKIITETIVIAENIVRSVARSVVDAITIVDTASKSTQRTVSDTVTVDSSLTKQPNKIVSETVTIIETFTKQPQKIVSETITLVETFTKQITKTLTDTISITEVISKIWNKIGNLPAYIRAMAIPKPAGIATDKDKPRMGTARGVDKPERV